jgi:hypothetical protein
VGVVLGSGIAGAGKAASDSFSESIKQQALTMREENMARINDIYAGKRQTEQNKFTAEQDRLKAFETRTIAREGNEAAMGRIIATGSQEDTRQDKTIKAQLDMAKELYQNQVYLLGITDGYKQQEGAREQLDKLQLLGKQAGFQKEVGRYLADIKANEPGVMGVLAKDFERIYGKEKGKEMFESQLKDTAGKEDIAIFSAVLKSIGPGESDPKALMGIYDTIRSRRGVAGRVPAVNAFDTLLSQVKNTGMISAEMSKGPAVKPATEPQAAYSFEDEWNKKKLREAAYPVHGAPSGASTLR